MGGRDWAAEVVTFVLLILLTFLVIGLVQAIGVFTVVASTYVLLLLVWLVAWWA